MNRFNFSFQFYSPSRTLFIPLCLMLLFQSCSKPEPIRVGVLHSLSGTMSISETAVKDATLMAIEEINAKGGILGRPVVPIVVDGKSDWPTFAEKADSLIQNAKVSVVFGCWTSASRKTVKPIFEKYDHLLFYPVQYEGLESSKNIVYTGAAPNQQIIPAVKWCFDERKARRFFLIGSDYVFPRTANEIIKEQVLALGGEVVGEEYILLGSKDVKGAVEKILKAKPDLILNTINGDSNIPFFNELRAAGILPEQIPTMSFSIAEDELRSFSIPQMVGDFAAWNYFQSVDSKDNFDFIERFRNKYGKDRVTDDPIEAGYFGVFLWAEAVNKAKSPEPTKVRAVLGDLAFDAPEGLVYVDKENQHTWKLVRIGKIREDGQFQIVWDSDKPIQPLPYPATRTKEAWQQFLDSLYKSWGGQWANPGKR
ncbi:MAG: urea ABC transporter substrate-binding protein [Chloroherpetonaceae bacterium]|nr:urea ABC transporter substrate-binding protein [Chloroherpetonaceae bacterium]